MPDYAKLAEAGRDAVVAASIVCNEVQGALDQVRKITKDDRSPVTVADFASQAVVAYALRERLGDIKLVAEETSAFLRDAAHEKHLEAALAAAAEVWPGVSEYDLLDAIDLGDHEPGGAPFWTLDPIDGTKGFLRGQQYAVALAYIEDATPVVGIMGCPNLPTDMSEPLDVPDDKGCLYWAIRGDGVYESSLESAHDDSTRLTRLDHDEDQEICITASVEKAHSSVSDTDRMLEWIERETDHPVGEPVRIDSQCKYAVVARGQADAYLRLPAKKGYIERIWDHAAGALIAAESGAAVSDIFGNELDFGHGRGLEKNKGIVCAPPRVHGLMLAAIEALGIGRE
ncbi:MAG: 3'(2'),5'-bisphosphate nucleotidase [Phycisphaerales bacterium]